MAKPGEKAEVSGVYRVTHDPAHKQPHEITMVKGHTFPPCPCQCRFKFPQMCRSKIPQSGGISVISRLTGDRWLHVWVDDRGGAAAVPGLAS